MKGSGALIRQSERAWEIPAPVVQARDTTGAGDVFAAGFLGGHLRGLALPACGALGLAMARRSMAGVGRAAYPTKTDFEQALGRVADGTVPESR
jgi:sugar/nucleoside kinase (ribokinase family)